LLIVLAVPSVALRAVSVEWEQQAQPKRKKRKQKSRNPQWDDANGSGSQQEKIF
jgi:hypothetical protein